MNYMQRSFVKFTSGLLLLVFSVITYAAEPVAMVTDVTGTAHLASQKTPAPLAVLTYLPPGEEIILDAGAHVVVTYFDESSEFSFKGPARIEIQQKIARVVKGVPASVRKLDKEKSAGAAKFARSGKLVFAAVEMRAIAFKPTLLSPVNTKISTLTPMFSWKSANEAENYQLVLNDDAGQQVSQVTVTSSSWMLPPEISLRPNVNYQWSLIETLKTGEKLTVKGNFSLADEQTTARVFAKRPATEADFSEKLTYAIFLESEGFRDDAKVIWRELAQQRPDDRNLKFRAR
ncbi:MAG: hypothetical protein PHP85_04685 [Gallionella sp.]|nr:hypothetical protein [Gallionella sp.]